VNAALVAPEPDSIGLIVFGVVVSVSAYGGRGAREIERYVYSKVKPVCGLACRWAAMSIEIKRCFF
jgi:hypothetical protein